MTDTVTISRECAEALLDCVDCKQPLVFFKWLYREELRLAIAPPPPPSGLREGLRDALVAKASAAVALRKIAAAEEAYRFAHDTYGDGDMRAGRAWDKMRRAGDEVRAALASPSEPAPAGAENPPSRNKPLAQGKPAKRRPKSYIARRRKPTGKVSRAK